MLLISNAIKNFHIHNKYSHIHKCIQLQKDTFVADTGTGYTDKRHNVCYPGPKSFEKKLI